MTDLGDKFSFALSIFGFCLTWSFEFVNLFTPSTKWNCLKERIVIMRLIEAKKGNFLVLVFILTCEKVNLVIIRNECWFIALIELSTKVCSVFSTIIDLKLPKEHRIRFWMCLSARVSIALPRSIKCSLYPTKVNMLLMLWGIPKTIQEQLPNRLTVTQH